MGTPSRPSSLPKLAEVKCLDDDVAVRREEVLPPSHGEVALTKRLAFEGKAIVNKKNELSIPRHAPTAEAALTLPAGSPVTSIWAASSRLLKDELKLHSLIVSGQRKPVNMVSRSPAASIDARPIKKVSACSPAPNVAVDRSGVNLPFHSKLRVEIML